MPEILSPAGNKEKLDAALLYGADAVYLAGKRFGMRSAADNFTIEELYDAARTAHSLGKKVYLTVNTLPRSDEYEALEQYFNEIKDANLDALIIADMGVMALAKDILPSLAIHMSTQSGVVSTRACEALARLGATRIVLARELTLSEMARIRRELSREIEIEAFVHGSMCVSFSGRCLLSNYLTGRDANRGECAQPCRWNYTICEEKRKDIPFPIEEYSNEGTFIMSSKDLCMIEHIPELVEAGIDSYKIEGRMKSAYYCAVVTNAYKRALTDYLKFGKYDARALLNEVESVSHREYATGYFFDDVTKNAQIYTDSGYIREKAYLAVAQGYDAQSGRAYFMQKNKFCKGDTVELISPGKDTVSFVANEIFDENGNELESVPHPFMKFYIPMPFVVQKGDILRGN